MGGTRPEQNGIFANIMPTWKASVAISSGKFGFVESKLELEPEKLELEPKYVLSFQRIRPRM